MAVTLTTAGASSAGSTQVTPAYPAGVAAGRVALLHVVTKPNTAAVVVPSGWTQVRSNGGGTGTQGVDTGQTRAAVLVRTLDGSESGSVTVDITSGNSSIGIIDIYQAPNGIVEPTAALPYSQNGEDATHGTAVSIAGVSGSQELNAGDLIIVNFASTSNGALDITFSSESITATGSTFSSLASTTNRTNQGDDIAGHRVRANVDSGPSSAAPTYASTASVNTSGAANFVRLAEKKLIAVGQPLETDVAQPITAVKSVTLGQAVETDIAQAITAQLSGGPIGQPIETDIAQPITAVKAYPVGGQAVETDVAQPITAVKSVTLGQAVETDIAQPVTLFHAAPPPPVPGATDTRVELLLGEDWTDITDKVYVRDAIQITRGQADEGSAIQPSTAALTLDNRDRSFSPRLPTGPYYGLLKRNTPVRIWVGQPPVGKSTASAGNTATHVAPSLITRLANARLICVWVGSGVQGDHTLPGGMTLGAATDVDISTMTSAHKVVAAAGSTGTQTATYSVTPEAWAAASVAIPPVAAGPAPAIAEILSSFLFTGGEMTLVTSPLTAVGDWLVAIQVRRRDTNNTFRGNPVGTPGRWTLVTDTLVAADDRPHLRIWVRRVQTAGTQEVTFTSDNFNGHAHLYRLTQVGFFSARFTGEVSAWPSRWDQTGADLHAPIEAGGIFRRLDSRGGVIGSALYREMLRTAATDPPIAYWPMEDEEGALSLASAIPGVQPMLLGAGVQLAANEDFVASKPIPTGGTGTMTGYLPDYVEQNETQIRFLLSVPEAGATAGSRILEVHTSGTIRRWLLTYDPPNNGRFTMALYNKNGNQIGGSVAVTTVPQLNGRPMRVALQLEEIGSDVRWSVVNTWVGTPFIASVIQQTVTNRTVGVVDRIVLNSSNDMADVAIGHLSVHDHLTTVFDLRGSLNAWAGERCGWRINRLCEEEHIPLSFVGLFDDTEFAGPQSVATLTQLLAEAAEVDGGILHERRDVVGLNYVTRFSRYHKGGP